MIHVFSQHQQRPPRPSYTLLSRTSAQIHSKHLQGYTDDLDHYYLGHQCDSSQDIPAPDIRQIMLTHINTVKWGRPSICNELLIYHYIYHRPPPPLSPSVLDVTAHAACVCVCWSRLYSAGLEHCVWDPETLYRSFVLCDSGQSIYIQGHISGSKYNRGLVGRLDSRGKENKRM